MNYKGIRYRYQLISWSLVALYTYYKKRLTFLLQRIMLDVFKRKVAIAFFTRFLGMLTAVLNERLEVVGYFVSEWAGKIEYKKFLTL
jgi:hypothetical protein